MSSLYEEIGGEPAVDAAVEVFYEKVLSDDRIKHFFAGIELDVLRGHQKKFLTMAFGGPNNYTGRGMKAAHARLVKEMGLDDTHFDAVVENLGATLTELNVPEALIAKAAAIAESTRESVLGRATA